MHPPIIVSSTVADSYACFAKVNSCTGLRIYSLYGYSQDTVCDVAKLVIIVGCD